MKRRIIFAGLAVFFIFSADSQEELIWNDLLLP